MKGRKQSEDLAALVDWWLDGVAYLVESEKRPFGSSCPEQDVIRALGIAYADANEEQWDDLNDYGAVLLAKMPGYISKRLKEAK